MLLHKLNLLLLLQLDFSNVFAHQLEGVVFRKIQIGKGLSASLVIDDALNGVELVLYVLKVLRFLQSNCLVEPLLILICQLPLRWVLCAKVLQDLSSLWKLLTLTDAWILILEVHDWRHSRLLFHHLRLFRGAALFGLISQSYVVTAWWTWNIKPLFQIALELLLLRIAGGTFLVKTGDLASIKFWGDTRCSFWGIEGSQGLALNRQVLLTRLLGLREFSGLWELVLRVFPLEFLKLSTHFLKSGHIQLLLFINFAGDLLHLSRNLLDELDSFAWLVLRALLGWFLLLDEILHFFWLLRLDLNGLSHFVFGNILLVHMHEVLFWKFYIRGRLLIFRSHATHGRLLVQRPSTVIIMCSKIEFGTACTFPCAILKIVTSATFRVPLPGIKMTQICI